MALFVTPVHLSELFSCECAEVQVEHMIIIGDEYPRCFECVKCVRPEGMLGGEVKLVVLAIKCLARHERSSRQSQLANMADE